MSSREERLNKNEASASEINEAIRSGRMAGEGPPDDSMLMVCECAHLWCEQVIQLNLGEYAWVRNHPHRYAVVPEHVVGDIEEVVEEHDDYVIVSKD